MAFKFGALPGYIPVGLSDMTWYAAGAFPMAPPKVAVPSVSPSADGTPWGIDGNDEYGNCGVAGASHSFMADASIAGENEVFPTRDQVVHYYLTYTGGQDSGVVLADFLSYVKKNSFYDHTVSAYAPVGVHDIPTLQFAIWAYGFTYTGIGVTRGMMEAFEQGQPWDLESLQSPLLGGHCIPLVGYDSSYLYAITWGKVQPIATAAWHYMSTEAWGVITGEFVSKGGDTRGLNLSALISDLNKVNS